MGEQDLSSVDPLASPSVSSPSAAGLKATPSESWHERLRRLGASKNYAGALALLRAPAPAPSVIPTPSEDDLAQYLRALAFRFACREGTGENLHIGQGLRAETERALTIAANRLERGAAR